MIVSHDHKYVFYLVPKTGSTTIRNLLKPYGKSVGELHGTAYIGSIGYAFWRDPVDRFVSAYNHLRLYKTVLTKLYPEHFAGVELPEPLNEQTFFALPSELQGIILNPPDLLWRVAHTNVIGFKPQYQWFNQSHINVLNYHDFEEEAKRIVSIFGGMVRDVPVENQKPHFIPDLELTDDLRCGIADMYHLDYMYDPR